MSVVNVQFGNSPASRLSHLRGLLAEKFPATELKPNSILATGLPTVDKTEGGLRKGAITELVGSSSSGALFSEAVLSLLLSQQCYAALIDTKHSFDLEGCEPDGLRRLLWVICQDVRQAIKIADLLLRDANLPLVMLDLQAVPVKELRSIPASTWHRFQRLVEQTSTAFVVLSIQPMVEAAQVRIAMRNRWTLDAMQQRRTELLAQINAQSFTRRQFSTLPEIVRKTA